MRFTIPPFLKKNDTVGIVATARWISEDVLQNAVTIMESWGYQVKVGKFVEEKNFQLAGNDVQRAQDLQLMLDDPEIKAIIIARGGYGTVRLLDRLNFDWFRKSPKWICGYSDVTALHSLVNSNLSIASIHSTMPISFPHATREAMENLRMALCGDLKEIRWKAPFFGTDDFTLKGCVLGGNLSVLYSLLGSSDQLKVNGDFLFIEDVDEMAYHIDRMMMAIKRSGSFIKAKALLVGGLTQMRDNTKAFGFELDNPWGKSAEEIIHEIAVELNLPVVFGFPAGHQNDNRAFYLGVDGTLSTIQGESVLRYGM
jgi:muramoyltetrapeptide carboxypeptidase